MFNINDEKSSRIVKDHPEARMASDDHEARGETTGHKLDSEPMERLHEKLISLYRQELDRQSDNRMQQAIDEDYYDSIQWSEDDATILRERGQAPLVYNVIAQSINWIIGSEKRGRTDYKVLGRRKEEAKSAEKKTQLLKYLSDVNRTPFHRSRAFEDATKVGIGWLEDGAQDEDDGEPLYSRYESWRNIIYDSASTELDFSDARFIARSKFLDLDVAVALFQDRKEVIESASISGERFGSFSETEGDDAMDSMEIERESHGIFRTIVTHTRERVRLIEMWYRTPEMVKKFAEGELKGQIVDEEDPRHGQEIGLSRVTTKLTMRVRVAIMTGDHLLYEGPSPYRHNRFIFTPIWAFRRGRDNLPYGVIRWMRDIQDSINKRASKALHILSTNKTVMEEGTLADSMSLDDYIEEVSRPDALIMVKSGKKAGLEMNVDRELAPAHLDLMSRDIQMLQQVGGVTDELLGRTTNAVSGVAINARQEQGSVTTNKLFDNLRMAVQMQGELQVSLIEQFMTEEKQFRITNARGNPDFITVNDGLPDNDIVRTKADFIISESEWRASMRQAAVDQFMQLLVKMPPQVAMIMLDLLVDTMDIPNREELVKRIREVNGMKDPDATEITPEEQQKMEAQAQAQQAQAQMMMLEMEGKAADNADKMASAEKKAAETARIKKQAIGDSVNSISTAMTAAQAALTMPTIAQAADGILEEAGWSQAHLAEGLPPMQPQQQEQQQQIPPEQMPPNGAAPSDMGIPQP